MLDTVPLCGSVVILLEEKSKWMCCSCFCPFIFTKVSKRVRRLAGNKVVSFFTENFKLKRTEILLLI